MFINAGLLIHPGPTHQDVPFYGQISRKRRIRGAQVKYNESFEKREPQWPWKENRLL